MTDPRAGAIVTPSTIKVCAHRMGSPRTSAPATNVKDVRLVKHVKHHRKARDLG
jgi:hypothetical protein